MKKSYIITASLIILFVALDLIIKSVMFSSFPLDQQVTVIKDFFYIQCVYNTGASFGMLAGKTWFFIISAFIALSVMIWFYIKSQNKSLLFSFTIAFLFSGAVGNLIDRIFLGKVRDYLYFNFFPAIFNFADICITIGVIMFIIFLIVDFIKEKKVAKNAKV